MPEEKITKLPYVNARVKADYIKGVASTQEGIKIILDVERILSDDELSEIRKLGGNSAADMEVKP